MGHRASFEMGPGHEPAPGARALLSGTPPILAMVPLHANLALLEEVGMPAVRAKSVRLTAFVLELADRWLADLD
ncbi:MAG TPA: kynureninase, partial [Actinoplanes sp.]|nr:kynureninase [Actinoplanes sp.]